jgi:hypothetical protein
MAYGAMFATGGVDALESVFFVLAAWHDVA